MNSHIGAVKASRARAPSRLIVLLQCLAITVMALLARWPLGGVAHAMLEASAPVVVSEEPPLHVHTVAPGETVRSIAEVYQVSLPSFLAAAMSTVSA